MVNVLIVQKRRSHYDTSMPVILPGCLAQIYWYRIYEMDI